MRLCTFYACFVHNDSEWCWIHAWIWCWLHNHFIFLFPNLIRHTPSDVHMPAINFMYVYCVVHTDYLIHHGIDNKRIEWIVCLHCDSMIKIRHWNTKHISILFGNFSFWLLQNWFLWTFKQKMQTIWMSLTLAHSCSLFGFNAISILTKFRGWHLHWFRIYHHSNGIRFIFHQTGKLTANIFKICTKQ